MITGFNTDIPFAGVTYHVQTEDKGLKTPLILSLVYVGGTIIASKRTPYNDLVEAGYDETALTERLQRQHKLICAAIKAGRVDDLKKMSGEAEASPNGPRRRKKEPAERKETPKAEAAKQEAAKAEEVKAKGVRPEEAKAEEVAPAAPVPEAAPAGVSAAGETDATATAVEVVEVAAPLEVEEWLEATPVEILPEVEELYLTLLEDEGEFRAGQLATIKVQVGHGAYGQRPAPDASVTIKVLGTSFRPLILSTRTDHEGVAVIRALLPRFTSGRAAVIIRAATGAQSAELRRIIHQY